MPSTVGVVLGYTMADGSTPKPAILSPGDLFVAMENKRNADKGTTDAPSPSDKEAPTVEPSIPSVDNEKTSRARSVEPEVSTEFQSIRKPRNPTVQKVVDTVRGAFAGKGNIDVKAKSPQDMEKLRRDVIAEDTLRMKSVKRYAVEAKSMLRTALEMHMAKCGATDLSTEQMDQIVSIVRSEKTSAGYRVVKGEIVQRKLSIEQSLAYTLGRHVVAMELRAAEQWVKHPTLFDVAAIVFNVGAMANQLFRSGSAMDKSFRAVCSGTYTAPVKRVVKRKPKSTENPSVHVAIEYGESI